MTRPKEPKIVKNWQMYTLKKARVEGIPGDSMERETFVRNAIEEFHTELKNAIATEQTLRAIGKQREGVRPGSQQMFDAAPNFWRVVGYGLFSSSISTVARMFDNKQGHGLQWCLGVCFRCCDVFTRDATIVRINGARDLQSYIAPDEKYFEELYQATKPCWDYFYSHFLPIRNNWIAHRILADSESASRLAEKFEDADVDAFFGRLAQLDRVLRQCFHCGIKSSVKMLDEPANFSTAMKDETDKLFSLMVDAT